MFLDNDVADFSLKSSGSTAKVEDKFGLVERDEIVAILGYYTYHLQEIFTFFQFEITLVA